MDILPPLKTAFSPNFTGRNNTQELYDQLLELVQKIKQDQPRSFYSIREIARFTRQSPTLVARVYKRLEGQGHLIILRSKETLVSGRKIHPFHSIKGTIGLPVWGYGFYQIHDLRSFYLSMIDRLKSHHFAIDLIFIDDDFDKLQRQILPVRHNLIVWYEPLRQFYPIMQTAQEQGSRNLILGKSLRKTGFREYVLNWQVALDEAMENWVEKGIKRVIIPEMNEIKQLHQGIIFSGKKGDLKFERLLCPDENSLKELLKRLKDKKDQGIYFQNDMDLHLLSRRHGQSLCDLFGVTSVLMSRSFDAHPIHCRPWHKTDIALMDWQKVAKTISLDIIRNQLSPCSPARRFQADYFREIPLIRLAGNDVNRMNTPEVNKNQH